MVGTQEMAVSLGGIGAGVGTTLAVRRQFDRTGETSIIRPSILWGIGTGVVALGAPMLMRGSNRGVFWEFVEDYGEAAIAAGAVSAFSPKGAGVQLPTLPA